ncbi:MAG: hypothetical protein NTW93_03425 [Phycisphaerae bacterium]|nr:hypothetical protein [Phycisphaerae bacterium]
MPQKRFTKWYKWRERNGIDKCKQPGVYAIAYSNKGISGKVFKWNKNIIYIGMTNSKGGLRLRLYQFDRSIREKSGHGGALRVLYKYPNYKTLSLKLYVSVCPFDCNVSSPTSKNLRIMGEVAKFEYICKAKYFQEFKQLPEFDDKNKKRPPKKRI